jgi:hypothetical protein
MLLLIIFLFLESMFLSIQVIQSVIYSSKLVKNFIYYLSKCFRIIFFFKFLYSTKLIKSMSLEKFDFNLLFFVAVEVVVY